MKSLPLPKDWTEQRQALGFNDLTKTLIFEFSARNQGAFYFREYLHPKWDIRGALFHSKKNRLI